MWLKKLDQKIGPILTRLWIESPPSGWGLFSPRASMLVIRPGGIGDAVLLAPALLHLKRCHPETTVTVLAEKRNAGVFDLCPFVDEVLLYNRPTDLWHTLRRRWDWVVDTEQWHRLSAVVARLCHAKFRAGFATNERARLFHFKAPYTQNMYESDSFFGLFGLTPPVPSSEMGAFLQIPEKARFEVAPLLPAKPFVALFPGASIAARRWGEERFAEVAQWVRNHGREVVIIGGPKDFGLGKDIVARAGGFSLAGRVSLAGTAAVLEQAQALVSGDSGVLHLAVGLDIPTVSLFGPGISAKWAPCSEKHVVLNKDYDCSPCTLFGTTPPCPYGVRCMKDITTEEVIGGLQSLD